MRPLRAPLRRNSFAISRRQIAADAPACRRLAIFAMGELLSPIRAARPHTRREGAAQLIYRGRFRFSPFSP